MAGWRKFILTNLDPLSGGADLVGILGAATVRSRMGGFNSLVILDKPCCKIAPNLLN